MVILKIVYQALPPPSHPPRSPQLFEGQHRLLVPQPPPPLIYSLLGALIPQASCHLSLSQSLVDKGPLD